MVSKDKLILNIDDDTWAEVLKHKIDMKAKKVNDAVVDLIKIGLNHVRKEKSSKK